MSYWDDMENPNRISSWREGSREEFLASLVGRKVVSTNWPSITLDDGRVVTFDQDASDCCSYLDLVALTTTDHAITSAQFTDNEDETGGEGAYKAALYVLTEAGVGVNVAEAAGDASNGYYLHGFALGITVTPKEDA